MGRSLRSLFAAFFIIALCSVIAGVFGPGLTGVKAATAGPEEDMKASIKQFTTVYDAVENNFADKVTSDKGIYKGAIPGMLRTLDPHSNFFDPKDFQSLRDEQSGHYYGVGMTVAPRNGKTIVVAPFGGSPAYKAGLRAGDAILEVNDKKTDNLSTTEIADLLKGPRGTHVQVTVAREGADKPLAFDIVRDEIPRYSVEEAFWLRPGVAFMKITAFNENTSQEMEEKLKKAPQRAASDSEAIAEAQGLVQAAKQADPKNFWRDQTEALLHRLGAKGRAASVTPNLVEDVSSQSPSEAAMSILNHLFGLSPNYLREQFRKIRKAHIK